MNTIREFCEERKLSKPLEDAFTMYCRSDYADRYMIRTAGETTEMLVRKMTQSQVEEAWSKFVCEIKNLL